MFPASVHTEKLLSHLIPTLPPQCDTHVVLLASPPTPYRNDTDREMPFRQESNFFYLTGCLLPSSFLILVISEGKLKDRTLLIPEIEEGDIMWSVPPPSLSEASTLYDFQSIKHTTVLQSNISEILQGATKYTLHTLPGTRHFPEIPEITRSGQPVVQDPAYLLPALHLCRLTKTPHEISLIRKACSISDRAHELVMRVLGEGVRRGNTSKAKEDGKIVMPGDWLIAHEAEAEALFVASCRREGSNTQAYLPIVASSNRASTLHYCCNDRAFSWGPLGHGEQEHFANGNAPEVVGGAIEPQVLLIDAGCEWNCYASDITRTMPVGNGGKFTKESGQIYDLVLEMQTCAFPLVRPKVHWDEVHLHTHLTLIRGFLSLGIFCEQYKGEKGERELLDSGVSWYFYPHGLGHSLGLDVHDVPSASKPSPNPTLKEKQLVGNEKLYENLRLRVPLQENMVVTVEPGVYFHPHLLSLIPHHHSTQYINSAVLAKYIGMGGVRIEDVVLVTGSGYETLSNVGKERKWVESACSGALQ